MVGEYGSKHLLLAAFYEPWETTHTLANINALGLMGYGFHMSRMIDDWCSSLLEGPMAFGIVFCISGAERLMSALPVCLPYGCGLVPELRRFPPTMRRVPFLVASSFASGGLRLAPVRTGTLSPLLSDRPGAMPGSAYAPLRVY